jgi:hypothetical protein
VTEFTYRSHAHVLLENFLEKYYFRGRLIDPGVDVVSLYVDQFPEKGDMARDAAAKYGFRIYPTIAEALTLGGSELAVDGVLSIAEFGKYPVNERGQIMYPRKRFWDETVAVFRQSARVVPVFNDKHLSYSWDLAKAMMDEANELKVPLLAGSSVPLAQRRPPLELPNRCEIEEAVSIHSGPMEIYDFHALEVLQSMIESRRGGETGVASVQLLEGEAVWEAAKAGEWSIPLAEAAMRAELPAWKGDLRTFVEPKDGSENPTYAILLRYRDGLRATVLRVGTNNTRWNFACRLAGETEARATEYYVGPWRNRNLFKALAHAIQVHVRRGRAPYPAERTLLATGQTEAAMESRHRGHVRLETPHLHLRYRARDFRSMRENGESWKRITEELPEPEGIDPGGK